MTWKTILLLTFAIGALATELSLRELCRSNGAEDKVEQVEQSLTDYSKCIDREFGVKSFIKEITQTPSNDAVKEIAKKYCSKSSGIKLCVHELFAVMSLCTGPAQRLPLEEASRAFDDAVDYLCHEDGSRIASFFEDGGYKCVQENAVSLNNCTRTMETRFATSSAFAFQMNQAGCAMVAELQNCAVNTMRTCQALVAANITETFMGYLRKAHSCTV